MNSRNRIYKFTDFLRLPRPRQLAGSEEPSPDLSGRARRSQNQFTLRQLADWGK